MRSVRVLIIMVATLALAACGSDEKNNDVNTPPPGTSTFLASGGTSTSGTGGTGGYVNIQSYGAVKVLRSGTVDASFNSSVAVPALSFGTDPYIVSGGTMTVLLDTDESGVLCTFYGDANLYIGDGDGSCDSSNDTMVTGLTVDAGATLVLVDQGYCGNGPGCGGYATLQLSNDLVINGTLTIDVNAASGIYIESNIIDVETGGMITSSATTTDNNAGAIYLGYGNNTTKTIINRGTIEAKGLGTGSGGYLYFDADDLIVNYGTIDLSGGSSATGPGGNANEIDIYLNSANNGKFYSSGTLLAKGGDSTDSNGSNGGIGGYIYIDVPDLVVNTGTIDVSGGNSDTGSGGDGGEFDVFVGYGDFNSSGAVRMNGGNGGTNGGSAEWGDYWSGYSAWIETAYNDNSRNMNGDIIISGTWEANGGSGANGTGGEGGDLYFQTDALGAVTFNANMSAKGGTSTESGFSGGSAAYGIDIYSYNYGSVDPVTPGKIRIAGQYDLGGGNGDEMGGNGGYFYIYSNEYNSSNKGSDVELVGFPALILNGGDGANGGSASSNAVQLYTSSPGGLSAGPITNEANIEARGGNAAASAFSTGGSGGYVQMGISGIGDPAEVINNSGSIDISGGSGDNGGSSSYMVYLWAQHVTNSGAFIANGGSGTTAGGSGGNITLNSLDMNTTNTGTLSVAGGTGATPLDSGSEGSVNIDTGSPF